MVRNAGDPLFSGADSQESWQEQAQVETGSGDFVSFGQIGDSSKMAATQTAFVENVLEGALDVLAAGA